MRFYDYHASKKKRSINFKVAALVQAGSKNIRCFMIEHLFNITQIPISELDTPYFKVHHQFENCEIKVFYSLEIEVNLGFKMILGC